MKAEDSIDLLNATHSFPCTFTLKVIGSAADQFVERVVAAVRDGDKHLEDDFPVSTRQTPNGKHVSVTMEPKLVSAEHVLAVYQRIRMVTGVIMTM